MEDARKRELKRAGQEQRARERFRASRAKLLKSDDETRLSKLQSYMDSTADAIVGVSSSDAKQQRSRNAAGSKGQVDTVPGMN